MMTEIISKPSDLKKKFPEELATNKTKALKNYLTSGGVIKLEEDQIIYPNTNKLERKLGKNRKELERLKEKQDKLSKKEKKLKTDKVVDTLKRITDPLYWEHKIKMVSNNKYKETHSLVNPPMHMLHKPKWRKRLKMFVKSEEYRERLHEAKTSKIGKKLTGMNKHLKQTQDFNMEMIGRKKQETDKKIKELEKQNKAMQTLLNWLKERT